MRLLRLLLVVSLINVTAFAKAQPVTLNTLHSALIGRAPMVVRFHAQVDPNEHNRRLCFDWTADLSSGRSCQDLAGADAPASYWKDITFRTSGEFVVSAWVERNDGHSYMSNIVDIRVLSLGD